MEYSEEEFYQDRALSILNKEDWFDAEDEGMVNEVYSIASQIVREGHHDYVDNIPVPEDYNIDKEIEKVLEYKKTIIQKSTATKKSKKKIKEILKVELDYLNNDKDSKKIFKEIENYIQEIEGMSNFEITEMEYIFKEILNNKYSVIARIKEMYLDKKTTEELLEDIDTLNNILSSWRKHEPKLTIEEIDINEILEDINTEKWSLICASEQYQDKGLLHLGEISGADESSSKMYSVDKKLFPKLKQKLETLFSDKKEFIEYSTTKVYLEKSKPKEKTKDLKI